MQGGQLIDRILRNEAGQLKLTPIFETSYLVKRLIIRLSKNYSASVSGSSRSSSICCRTISHPSESAQSQSVASSRTTLAVMMYPRVRSTLLRTVSPIANAGGWVIISFAVLCSQTIPAYSSSSDPEQCRSAINWPPSAAFLGLKLRRKRS